MFNRERNRKDLTLTTLIDLLVQIVFLLAFFIVISKAFSLGEDNYEDLWRHLVESIFNKTVTGDPPPPKQTTNEAVAEVKRLRLENEKLRKELDDSKGSLATCKSELKAKCGGPPPVCEMALPLLAVKVTDQGLVSVTPTRAGSKELADLGLDGFAFETGLSSEEFKRQFERISLKRADCRYRVNVSCEDRNLPTWQYEKNLTVIMSLFSTPNSQRTCR